MAAREERDEEGVHHLALPDDSVFVDEPATPTASVLVAGNGVSRIALSDVEAIVHLQAEGMVAAGLDVTLFAVNGQWDPLVELVAGAVVLIGGDPGIGKSTLLLQVLSHLARQHNTLYVSGEESAQQIALRTARELRAAQRAPVLARLKGRHEKLVLEPGRRLVGNAGLLLTRIEYLKQGEAKKFCMDKLVDFGLAVLRELGLVDEVLAVGDTVKIMETRPLSKLKRWSLAEVIRKNAVAGVDPPLTARWATPCSDTAAQSRSASQTPVRSARVPVSPLTLKTSPASACSRRRTHPTSSSRRTPSRS